MCGCKLWGVKGPVSDERKMALNDHVVSMVHLQKGEYVCGMKLLLIWSIAQEIINNSLHSLT